MENDGGLMGKNYSRWELRWGVGLFSGLCTRRDVVDDNWVVVFLSFQFLVSLGRHEKRACSTTSGE